MTKDEHLGLKWWIYQLVSQTNSTFDPRRYKLLFHWMCSTMTLAQSIWKNVSQSQIHIHRVAWSMATIQNITLSWFLSCDGDGGCSPKLKFVRLGYWGTNNLLYGLYPMLEECKQITHTWFTFFKNMESKINNLFAKQ